VELVADDHPPMSEVVAPNTDGDGLVDGVDVGVGLGVGVGFGVGLGVVAITSPFAVV
jgi:hypothetical protein